MVQADAVEGSMGSDPDSPASEWMERCVMRGIGL
jgi:hypothetical protein